jgi:Tubulin folding cofactor D C terminal
MIQCAEGILRNHVENDRVSIPVVEALAGLLEESVFSRIHDQYEYLLIHPL